MSIIQVKVMTLDLVLHVIYVNKGNLSLYKNKNKT
jgi:hypothetical protein